MAPSAGALWRQRRRWSAGLGRALRDHGAGAFVNGARHLPIVVLTLSSLVWMLASLVLGGPLVLGYAGQSDHAFHFDRNNFVSLFLIGLAAFFVQLATAIAVDGRMLTWHWRGMLIAPVYPAYFWLILATSFAAGFPKGFLRRDNGSWRHVRWRDGFPSPTFSHDMRTPAETPGTFCWVEST